MAATPKARLYKVITPPKPGGGITVEVGKSFTYGGGTEGMTTSVKAINRLGLTTNSIAIMVAKMNATFAESMKMQIQQQQELADQREEGVQKLVDQRKAEAEDIKQKENLEEDLEGENQQEAVPKEKKGFGYKAGAVVGAVSNAFGFFEGIAKFIGRIFRTMVTVAFLKWMGNPENLKKVEKVVQGVTRIGKWLLKIAGFLINMGLDGLTDFLENPLSFKGIFGIVKFLTAAAVFFAPAKMAALGMKGVMALFKGGKLFKLIGGMLKGLMGVFKGVLGFIMARPRAALMVGAGVLAAWGLKSLFGGGDKDEDEDEDDPDKPLNKKDVDKINKDGQPEKPVKGKVTKQRLTTSFEDGVATVNGQQVDPVKYWEFMDLPVRVRLKKGLSFFEEDGEGEKEEKREQKREIKKVKKEEPIVKKKRKVKPVDKNIKIGRKTYDLSQPRGGLTDDEWTNEIDGKTRRILTRNINKYNSQKQMARGGWITGPQSGYPVSLDGGRSTSFIGHGTEYVAQKKTGGAFVVPYDTPATRGNAGLTDRRTQEASNKGFSIPGFSAGGLLQDMKNGGNLKYGKNTLSDELGHTRGTVTDPEEKRRIEEETLYWVNKERTEFLGLPPLKKITYADGVELTKAMGKEYYGAGIKEESSDDMNFDTMTRTKWKTKQRGKELIFEGSEERLTEEDKQAYLASNPEARFALELKDQMEMEILGADISASAKKAAGRLSAGGMVPKAELTGEYINVQAMSEGGEFDEGGGDSDGGVSIHKGDLAPIKMGKQADAGPPPPIFVDSKYEVPANDYFQTRYGLMAEGNTAPVEMF